MKLQHLNHMIDFLRNRVCKLHTAVVTAVSTALFTYFALMLRLNSPSILRNISEIIPLINLLLALLTVNHGLQSSYSFS